jgi:2-methylcitrate dehydratase
LPERLSPKTRESADHSIPFLVAVALTTGDLKQEDFENERWNESAIRDLMAKTHLAADKELSDLAAKTFPAVVEVELQDGTELRSAMIDTPGSPARPWGTREIEDKFRRLDRVGLNASQIAAIGEECLDLLSARSVKPLMNAIR